MVFQCFIQKDANFDMYFRIFTRIMVLTGKLPPSRLRRATSLKERGFCLTTT